MGAPIAGRPRATEKPAPKDNEEGKAKQEAVKIGQGPLGGWSFLQSLDKEVVEEASNMELVEGCRVMLTGLDLKRKNGTTGVAIKQMSNGRWKVKMDDDSGYALLPDQRLKRVASPHDAVAGDSESQQQDVDRQAKEAAEEAEKRQVEEMATQ